MHDLLADRAEQEALESAEAPEPTTSRSPSRAARTNASEAEPVTTLRSIVTSSLSTCSISSASIVSAASSSRLAISGSGKGGEAPRTGSGAT